MPKTQDLDFYVPGSPDEVAARMSEKTRYRLLPYRGSIFGGGAKPFGGSVDRTGFNVAMDERDWWTLTQAVASCTFEADGPGTRVKGTVGLPNWATWQLRITFIIGVVMSLSVMVSGITGAGMIVVLVGLIALLAVAVLGSMGMGMHVANADKQVDSLAAQVKSVAEGSAVAAAREQTASDPEEDRLRKEAMRQLDAELESDAKSGPLKHKQ